MVGAIAAGGFCGRRWARSLCVLCGAVSCGASCCKLWAVLLIVRGSGAGRGAGGIGRPERIGGNADGDGIACRLVVQFRAALVLRFCVGLRSRGCGRLLLCVLGDLSVRLRGSGGEFIGGGGCRGCRLVVGSGSGRLLRL